MRSTTTWAAWAMAALLVSLGCGGEGPSVASAPRSAGDPPAQIWNGSGSLDTPANNRVVLIYGRYEYERDPPTDNHCTGTLITSELVLTAAHCVNVYADLKVLVGPDRDAPTGTRALLGDNNCRLAPSAGPGRCFSGDPEGLWRSGSVRSLWGTRTDPNPEDDSDGRTNIDLALLRLRPAVASDLDAAHAQKPYLDMLPGSGSGTSASWVGYGFMGQGVGLNATIDREPLRQTSSVWDGFSYELNRNWIYAYFGDAAHPLYRGTDHGDSGGPLSMRYRGGNPYPPIPPLYAMQQVGVLEDGCSPGYRWLIDDPDGNADSGDEVWQERCRPKGIDCGATRFWDGYTAQCRAFCASGKVWDGSACVARRGAGDAQHPFAEQKPYFSRWMNLNAPEIKRWLLANVVDPDRPGRWIGETDYSGPRRPSDSSGLRSFDGLGNGCPNVFDADDGFSPELRASPPVIYGAEGVDLHDRVKVYADYAGQTYGDVALRSGPLLVRNDVRLGKIWGGDSLEADWRSSWTGAVMNHAATHNFQGTYPDSMIPQGDANVPAMRFTAKFPSTKEPELRLQNCNNGEVTPLAAGRYLSSLVVLGKCGVQLGSGPYYFDSLDLEPDARLLIKGGTSTRIYVRDQLVLRGKVSNTGSRGPASHVIGYFGTADVALDRYSSATPEGGFWGTVVAPNATLILGNNGFFSGAYYAKRVDVHQGSKVQWAPCQGR